MENKYVTVEQVKTLSKKQIQEIFTSVNIETKGLTVVELRELLEERIIDGLEVKFEQVTNDELNNPDEEFPSDELVDPNVEFPSDEDSEELPEQEPSNEETPEPTPEKKVSKTKSVEEQETSSEEGLYVEVTKSFFAEVKGGREYHAIYDVLKVTPAFERKYKDFLKISTEAEYLEFEEGKSCPK